MNVRRRRRALAALVLLAAMGTGTAEAVAGEFMDSREHYEDDLSHVHGHSGSEAGGAEVVSADQDSDDQHIKGYDHCNHTHGSSVRAPALPGTKVSVVSIPAFVDILARPPDAPATGLYHPPKA